MQDDAIPNTVSLFGVSLEWKAFPSCWKSQDQLCCSNTLQLMTSVLFLAGTICEVTGTTGKLTFQLATFHTGYLCVFLRMQEAFKGIFNGIVHSHTACSILALLAAYLSRYHGRKRGQSCATLSSLYSLLSVENALPWKCCILYCPNRKAATLATSDREK